MNPATKKQATESGFSHRRCDNPLNIEENKLITLKNAIQQGINSPRVENFGFDEHLAKLKSEKRNNG